MRYRVTTPDQVHFHYETAGLFTRAMAWLADQLILVLLRIGIAWATGGARGPMGTTILLLGIFVVDFGYYVFFEHLHAGRTPGKRIFKIRVISASGGKLGFSEVMVRNLLRPLDWLPFGMLLGGIVAFLDPCRRRLGDMAAETLVVKAAERKLPDALLARHDRDNSYMKDVTVRGRILARANREERDLILDLMLRRDELDPAVREDLFSQAAEHLRTRYDLPTDHEFLSDEQVVLNVALVIQSGRFVG